MKSLTKAQIADRTELAERIRKAHSALETAVDHFNGQLSDMEDEVRAELATLNEAIADASTWLGEVSADMELHYEGRSEKWQEGEKGQAYLNWKEQYEESAEEEVEIDFPASIELPDCDLAETLESLPDEP